MCRYTFTNKRFSRTVEIDFQAVEDSINSISAGKGQYPVKAKQISKFKLIRIHN